jgi:AcrR family transcriptional regulator
MARLTDVKSEKNRERILEAATKAFSRSGYSAVTIRDIAKSTKLSLGSHYNYYDDKLELFKAVIDRTTQDFMSPENEVIQYFMTSEFPDDLPRLAKAIKVSIEKYESYFRLMYVDAIEFDGKHIREVFSNLEAKFNVALGKRFKEVAVKRKTSPGFAMVTIYLSFYQYFLMSKLFGAQNIFENRSETQVINEMVNLFKNGFVET